MSEENLKNDLKRWSHKTREEGTQCSTIQRDVVEDSVVWHHSFLFLPSLSIVSPYLILSVSNPIPLLKSVRHIKTVRSIEDHLWDLTFNFSAPQDSSLISWLLAPTLNGCISLSYSLSLCLFHSFFVSFSIALSLPLPLPLLSSSSPSPHLSFRLTSSFSFLARAMRACLALVAAASAAVSPSSSTS